VHFPRATFSKQTRDRAARAPHANSQGLDIPFGFICMLFARASTGFKKQDLFFEQSEMK
jgi:hypothetical protein